MDVQFTPVFWRLYKAAEQRPRYISMPGGTRSGKTYSILQLLNILIPAADSAGDVTSVVSETLPHLKRGAIRDFENIIGHPLKLDPHWNASDNVYTYDNGAKLEFFSVDSPGKVQGPARKRLFVNECNHIELATFLQLEVRTTGLIILDYNPSATFWCIEKIEPRQNCIRIHSTYKDNTFLTPEQVASIEANKGAGNWWRVYGLGLIGQIEGQIFDFKIVDEMPDALGYIETWGMDFGFTNDPTTVIRCLVHTGRREIYADQLLWQTGMTNPEIAAALKDNGIRTPGNGPTVWADCAEPKSIEEVRKYGVNIKPCDKRVAVREQLQSLQAWTIYVTRRSVDLINEGRRYLFKQRPDGTYSNEPIDFFNHGIDALRYACYTGANMGSSRGRYSISFNN